MSLLMFFVLIALSFIAATIFGIFLLDIKTKNQGPSVPFTLNGNIHPDSENAHSNIYTQNHSAQTSDSSIAQNQKGVNSQDSDLYKHAYSAAGQV